MPPASFRVLVIILFGWVGIVQARMVVEVYPLDLRDFETASSIAKSIVSEGGRLVADKARNRLVLYDFPDKQEALKLALAKIQNSTRNIRIQVSFNEQGQEQSSGLGVEGTFRSGNVTVGVPNVLEKGRNARIQAYHTQSTRNSLIRQELLVMSGGQARLQVGSEIPYAEWFWNYGVQNSLWPSTVRWKEVGSKMIVEPYVIGNRIRVKLTPEFSYLINGQTLATALEKLSTEVIVDNGATIDIGGLPVANREFFDRFLTGYNQQGIRQSLRITLRPTIE